MKAAEYEISIGYAHSHGVVLSISHLDHDSPKPCLLGKAPDAGDIALIAFVCVVIVCVLAAHPPDRLTLKNLRGLPSTDAEVSAQVMHKYRGYRELGWTSTLQMGQCCWRMIYETPGEEDRSDVGSNACACDSRRLVEQGSFWTLGALEYCLRHWFGAQGC